MYTVQIVSSQSRLPNHAITCFTSFISPEILDLLYNSTVVISFDLTFQQEDMPEVYVRSYRYVFVKILLSHIWLRRRGKNSTWQTQQAFNLMSFSSFVSDATAMALAKVTIDCKDYFQSTVEMYGSSIYV